MPPWEMIKALFSLLVTDGVDGCDEEPEMDIFDISRAHFMPNIDCETYVEVPDEDRSPEDCDVVGRLNRNMYGRRVVRISDHLGSFLEIVHARGVPQSI